MLLTGAGVWIHQAAASKNSLPDRKGADKSIAITKPTPKDADLPSSKRKKVMTGHSVRGRTLVAERVGNLSSTRRILVVGSVHGDESAGVPVARDLISDRPLRRAQLVVIPDLNPDGRAAGTRQNARGVDLNRNFPWRWQPLGPPGSLFYSGRRPLSEPESRFAHAVVNRVHPSVGIWFHQHLNLVDRSGGNVAIERGYARIVGLPLRKLSRYPGSAVGWENHRFAGSTAFVVELPSGRLTPGEVERFSDGIRTLARSLP